MVMARFTATVQDAAGNGVSGCQIEVRSETSGQLVPVYSDRDGTVSLGNPFTASDPTFGFHALGGAYKITAFKGSFQSIWRYVAIGTAAETDLEDLSQILDELVADKLDADGSNATARTKWRFRTIGEIVYVDTGLTGVEIPPPDSGFIELTAGLDGDGEYNEGKLTGETINGSGATLVATAVIDDAASPMDGQTIHLINTEERVRYAGERAKSGDVFNDQGQLITGKLRGYSTSGGYFGLGIGTAEGAFSTGPDAGRTIGASAEQGNGGSFLFSNANSPGARAGDRTRAKGQFLVAFLKFKDVA